MNANLRSVGWLAIGLGALALVVALMGRGFGMPAAAAGFNNAAAPQAYAQQDAGEQHGPNALGTDSQSNAGPQAGGYAGRPGAPGGNDQRNDQQRGQGGPGAGVQGQDRPQAGPGFGMGGWFRFLPRLGGGLFQTGLLALVALLGLWLIRGRNSGSAPAAAPAAPAPEPAPQASEPEAESYIDETRDPE